MTTAGEHNALASFWLAIVIIFVGRLGYRIGYGILLMESVLKAREHVLQGFVRLQNMSTCIPEIRKLEKKHVTEFLGIFSVKENPKIPLRKFRAPDIEFQVRRSFDSLTITFPQTHRDIQVYTHIPSEIAKDVFYPASANPSVSKRPGGFLMHALRSVLPGKRKNVVDDGYRSFDDESETGIGTESVGQRIGRLMHMYMMSNQDSIHVDYEPNTDDSIPCMVIIGDSQHDFSHLILFTADQEDEINVYFDPNRETFVPIKPIPDFFGIEERTCMICCDANINTVLMDCCHCTSCENCANSLRDGRCPICRNTVTEKVIIPLRNAS